MVSEEKKGESGGGVRWSETGFLRDDINLISKREAGIGYYTRFTVLIFWRSFQSSGRDTDRNKQTKKFNITWQMLWCWMYRIPLENGRGNYNPAWASWNRVRINIVKKKGRADREIGKNLVWLGNWRQISIIRARWVGERLKDGVKKQR